MPPALSVREKIYEDIVATLNTITVSNGYATTLGTVRRGALSPLETDVMPTASLIPVSDEPTYGVGVNRWQITCTIRIWIDAVSIATAAATLEALIADVQVALQVDNRRSGNAEQTLTGLIQYLYLQSTETIAGADLVFMIDYKTSLTSPRVAL